MLLAWQNFGWIQITIFLLIEVIKYLLDQDMPFVLSERFKIKIQWKIILVTNAVWEDAQIIQILISLVITTLLYKSRGKFVRHMVIQEEDRTKKGHGKKLVITKCQKNGIKQTKTTYLILTLCLFLILLKIKCDTVVQKNELIFLYMKLGSTSNFKQIWEN